MSYYGFPKARSKADKLDDAAKAVKKLAAKGIATHPVRIEGMKIAKTFWGKAWCDNLESYRDYEYRLDRGRSYVRSGCVVDLQSAAGLIRALVQGSSLYTVTVSVAKLPDAQWKSLRAACLGRIDSLLALLAGKFPDEVMRVITRRPGGLFPEPTQIKLDCTCPDGANMCKHVAAAMYGIGHRLDAEPNLLFLLRGIDPSELVKAASADLGSSPPDSRLADDGLGALFGIYIDEPDASPVAKTTPVLSPMPSAKFVTLPNAKVTPRPKTKGKPNALSTGGVTKAKPKKKPLKAKAVLKKIKKLPRP